MTDGWREVMGAGAMGVVDSAWDLVDKHGVPPEEAAKRVLARKPVLAASATDYLVALGLTQILDSMRDEAAEFRRPE